MIDSIKRGGRTIPIVTPGSKIKKAQESAPDTNEKKSDPILEPKPDRRKKDRRQNQHKSRGPYDMRSGRGRRKDDKNPPPIEINV